MIKKCIVFKRKFCTDPNNRGLIKLAHLGEDQVSLDTFITDLNLKKEIQIMVTKDESNPI